MELEPTLSLGSCDVSLSNDFLFLNILSSHFHDVAPLGPPSIVDSASAFCGPARFDCFAVVHCSNLSDSQHSLSLDCSCSLCGCGSLCGLLLPNKPLSSQVPSASRSPEIN